MSPRAAATVGSSNRMFSAGCASAGCCAARRSTATRCTGGRVKKPRASAVATTRASDQHFRQETAGIDFQHLADGVERGGVGNADAAVAGMDAELHRRPGTRRRQPRIAHFGAARMRLSKRVAERNQDFVGRDRRRHGVDMHHLGYVAEPLDGDDIVGRTRDEGHPRRNAQLPRSGQHVVEQRGPLGLQ